MKYTVAVDPGGRMIVRRQIDAAVHALDVSYGQDCGLWTPVASALCVLDEFVEGVLD